MVSTSDGDKIPMEAILNIVERVSSPLLQTVVPALGVWWFHVSTIEFFNTFVVQEVDSHKQIQNFSVK